LERFNEELRSLHSCHERAFFFGEGTSLDKIPKFVDLLSVFCRYFSQSHAIVEETLREVQMKFFHIIDQIV